MLGAGAGDTSSPDLVVHPAFSACLLPKRRPLNVPFPKPEPKTTAEEQKLRNPPRSMDACGWPVSAPRASLDALLSETQKPGAEMKLGKTLSMAVIQRGSLVGHLYGPTSSPTTRLVSWSMAKSFVHAMLGVLVLRGILPFDLEVEAPLPEWKVEGQKGVTMRQLVEMRSGRAWAEDYVEGDQSDVIQMVGCCTGPLLRKDQAHVYQTHSYSDKAPRLHPHSPFRNHSSIRQVQHGTIPQVLILLPLALETSLTNPRSHQEHHTSSASASPASSPPLSPSTPSSLPSSPPLAWWTQPHATTQTEYSSVPRSSTPRLCRLHGWGCFI